MISREQVKQEVAQALAQREHAGMGMLTISGEADLQALVKLIREMGSNPLLAEAMSQGKGHLHLQVKAGAFEGCACQSAGGGHHAEQPGSTAVTATASMAPALGGLVTLKRLQAGNLEGRSLMLLDQDAVLTPTAKDWLRQNKIQVQRGEL